MMAAGAEGITLLSMYGDDEEDEEAFDAPSEGGGAGEEANEISSDENIRSVRLPFPVRDNTPQLLTPTSLTRAKGGVNSKTPMNALPLPIHSLQQWVSRSQPSSLEGERDDGGYIAIGTELQGPDEEPSMK